MVVDARPGRHDQAFADLRARRAEALCAGRSAIHVRDTRRPSSPWPLGMTITPSYVGGPECNGVIERFMRTLKEQFLYLHRFRNLAEARRIIGEFIARYNTEWLIERLGHQTPVAARAALRAA